jgi:tetratricopeptide (TPR) repeat protein
MRYTIMSSKMTLALLFAGWLFAGGMGLAAEPDYAARFKELQNQKADAQIEPLLNEWREKKPNDPEAWITSANYYFNQSVAPTISTKKPEKGDFSLTNKKTGKAAGSISFKPNVGETSHRATDLLQEATTKFSDRLDIWCGLAFIYQEMGDFDSELATLKRMVAYAHDHAAQLQWLKGEPLGQPADQFIAEKLHGYSLYYEKKENPEDDKRFLQIAMFGTEQFPNLPYAFNDVAQFYYVSGDKKKAREWLEKASKVDPKDTLVLMNLGNVSLKLGDSASARKYFEEVVKVDPNGEYAPDAKDALRKLKKK